MGEMGEMREMGEMGEEQQIKKDAKRSSYLESALETTEDGS